MRFFLPGIQTKARSPAVQNLVVQLAGPGTCLPTERAMAFGGYGAFVQDSQIGPDGGQVLVEETAAARELAAIPGVLDFTIKRQTSPKLDHAFGISMRFAGREDHDACNAHPLHARFPEEHQFREVTDFEEL